MNRARGHPRNPTKDGGKIGPEFTFGLTMDAALAEPVLIIKTAWGGKSLHTDFRLPSAGAYQLNDYQKKLYYGPPGHGVPKDMEQWLAEKKKDSGHHYRLMVDHVKKVLANPKRVVSGYDAAQGYELAGFVWLQGWKVRQMSFYLNSQHKDHANADGKMTDEQKREHLKKCEADRVSPAEVALWKRGASNAGYHYLGSAKTFAQMGKAFAETTLELMAIRLR